MDAEHDASTAVIRVLLRSADPAGTGPWAAAHMRCMTRVFYWADLHVSHALVAEHRGYSSRTEHDEALAEAWVETVTKRDSIWLLGDLAASSPRPGLDLLAKLPGTKHLVLGNHDVAHPMHLDAHRHQRKYLDVFATVQTGATRRVGNHHALLSHFPYEGDGQGREDRYSQWRLRDEGRWLIHGHVHEVWRIRGRQINVGVDHCPSPASADELSDLMDEHETYLTCDYFTHGGTCSTRSCYTEPACMEAQV